MSEPRRLLTIPPPTAATGPLAATRGRPRVLDPREPPGLSDPAPEGAPAEVPALDLDALDRPRALGAPVSLDPGRAAPVPFGACRHALLADCLERAAMLGRHRRVRALAQRARIEERLLAQRDALAVAGVTGDALLAYAEEEGPDDPWAVWAAVFVLATTSGATPLALAYELVCALPEEARVAAALAADALAVSPHPHLEALARDLLDAAEPFARAAGIDVLLRRGWLAPEGCLRFLDGEPAAVVASALRAVALLEPRAAPWKALQACLGSEDADVAWRAARALLLLGDRDPYLEVRKCGAFAQRLGVSAIELLVLAGAPEDIGAVQRLAQKLPITAALLDAVARFGHPAARGYLLGALAHESWSDAAAAALATLFGPAVEPERRADPAAWRAATSGIDTAKPVRLRRGNPWSSKVVSGECASLELSQEAVAARVDELHARTGQRAAIELEGFWPELRPALGAV